MKTTNLSLLLVISLILTASLYSRANIHKDFSAWPTPEAAATNHASVKHFILSDSMKIPMSFWTVSPDYSYWEALLDNNFSTYAQYWNLATEAPIQVSVRGQEGQPVINANVQLIDKADNVLLESHTNLQGEAFLWGAEDYSSLSIRSSYQNESAQLHKISKGKNTIELPVECQQLSEADIVFLMDATNSMRDEFSILLPKIKATGRPILLARDQGERYLVQQIKSDTPSFTQQAAGGGKDTESMDLILMEALEQYSWKEDASSRLLVYLTDALPHRSEGAAERLNKVVKLANEYGVNILPVAASGLNEEGEYLLQSLAIMTGGSYAWLEDNTYSPSIHRLPLLQNESSAIDLENWLNALFTKHEAVDNCADLQATFPTTGNASNTLRCFPNPAINQTSIELPEAVERISIFNSNGSLIKEWSNVTEGTIPLDVSPWSAGIYWIEVEGMESMKLSVVKE